MRKKIGPYTITGELGSGGMGVVYQAEQELLGREVVIKGLRRDLPDREELEQRFQREAREAARIHHQNVVAVYDCFAFRGELYIVQEYVPGRDLASVLQVVGRIAPRIAGLIALELARGLEEIHANGIVHRDLKPGNLIASDQGAIKIADFGIAQGRKSNLTQVGQTVGTPPYMSPEQMLGERIDPRSDLFSLGVVVYELIAGEPPFPCPRDPADSGAESEAEGAGDRADELPTAGVARAASEPPSLLRRIEKGHYRPLRKQVRGVPRGLRRTLTRCLRAKSRRRPQTSADVRRALERALGHPAPATCRAEIADWLWERKVFQTDGARTVRTPRSSAPQAMPRLARVTPIVATALLLALGALGTLWLVARHVPGTGLP